MALPTKYKQPKKAQKHFLCHKNNVHDPQKQSERANGERAILTLLDLHMKATRVYIAASVPIFQNRSSPKIGEIFGEASRGRVDRRRTDGRYREKSSWDFHNCYNWSTGEDTITSGRYTQINLATFFVSLSISGVSMDERKNALIWFNVLYRFIMRGRKNLPFIKKKNGNEQNASPTGGEEKDREKFNPQHSHKHKDKQKQRQPNSV